MEDNEKDFKKFFAGRPQKEIDGIVKLISHLRDNDIRLNELFPDLKKIQAQIQRKQK